MISADMDGVREAVLDLHERRGWEALGYESWRECVTAEFPQSESYLYRELTAARVERNLSPMGEIHINERCARVLAKLKDPKEQVLAYTEACELALDGTPTAAILAEVVGAMLPEKKPRALAFKSQPLTRRRAHETALMASAPAVSARLLVGETSSEGTD